MPLLSKNLLIKFKKNRDIGFNKCLYKTCIFEVITQFSFPL